MMGAIAAGVSAVASIALAIVAGLGLRQLTLTKRDMKTRSERDGIAYAVAQCRIFGDQIIPMWATVTEKLAQGQKKQIEIQNPRGLKFDIKDPKHPIALICRDWIEGVSGNVTSTCLALLNQVELFAMNFTSGLADAEIAFRPTSDVLFQIVVKLYPFIILLRTDRDPTLYFNTVELFQTWMQDKSAATIQEQMVDLQNTFDRLQTGAKPRLVVKGTEF
jgi:hypothetical protein